MSTTVHLFKGHIEGSEVVVESSITLCCKVWATNVNGELGTVVPGEETCEGTHD